MAQYFHQILIGKKLFEGKVLPVATDVSSPNAVIIERFLGIQRGGEIFQCRFSGNNKVFLVKIPAPPLEQTHKYLTNEIEVLEKLAKPGLAQIPGIQASYISGSQKQLPLYLSPLVVSATVHFPELAQRKPISHLEAIKIFYLLAKSLEYLSGYQIAHCDIHPETVQFYDRMPILTHFGAAKNWSQSWSEERGPAAKYGDPLWLPPEVLSIEAGSNAPEISFHPQEFGDKTDVWALGLLWMYYLTGSKIFEDMAIDGSFEGILQNMQNISQKQMMSRYRNRCKLFLDQRYLAFGSEIDEEQFIAEIGDLFLMEQEKESPLTGIDHDKVVRFGIDSMMATRKKLMSQGRQKSKFLKEVYLQMLMTFFDMCTAPVKLRVNAQQLVVTLDSLLPGLSKQAHMVQSQPYVPLFQDASKVAVPSAATPVGQGSPLLRPQTFRANNYTPAATGSGGVAQPNAGAPAATVFERPRSQLRHSMKNVDTQKVQNLIQQERHRYFGKKEDEEKNN